MQSAFYTVNMIAFYFIKKSKPFFENIKINGSCVNIRHLFIDQDITSVKKYIIRLLRLLYQRNYKRIG